MTEFVSKDAEKYADICVEFHEHAVGVAKLLDVDATIPFWIINVPDKKKSDAITRHLRNAFQREKLKASVREQQRVRKAHWRSIVQPNIDAIAAHGYELTYLHISGYWVAIAYHQFYPSNSFHCEFVVCSREDVQGMKETGRGSDRVMKHEFRSRLLKRIKAGEDGHSFDCDVPLDKMDGKTFLSRLIKQRFYEYAMMSDEGLPHEMVSIMRSRLKRLHRSDRPKRKVMYRKRSVRCLKRNKKK